MKVDIVETPDAGLPSVAGRYRLFLYTGPTYELTALDFSDSQVHEVLEAAGLAGKDGLLWSLALVVSGMSAVEELIWLSGGDYAAAPRSAAEWHARGVMQDRLLKRSAAVRQPPTLPDGRRVIRFFPDHGREWPLWESFTDHYAVKPQDLDLSPSLADRLADWQDDYNRRGPDEPSPPEWLADGRALAEALRSEVAESAEVRPWPGLWA